MLDLVAREQEDREAQSREGWRRARPAPAGPSAAGAGPGAGGGGQEVLEPAQNNDPHRSPFVRRLIGGTEGRTAVLLAAREGHSELVHALLDAGADIDQRSAADGHTPLLMSIINGTLRLGLSLLERGADVLLQSDAGPTRSYAALNAHWLPKSRHPQPTDLLQQETSYWS